MKTPIRPLTPREKELLLPFITAHVEAQKTATIAGQQFTRALQLAEPRFGDPTVSFDLATLTYYEDTPEKDGGAPHE